MEGNLGILYVCGEQTDGKITVVDSLLGRKVRAICGGYDRFVALVDAWELDWAASKERNFESQLVEEGLKDVKVHHVAVGKNHNVVLSLDGQLFSWGEPGTMLQCSELGHQRGLSNVQKYRVRTPGPESDDTTATGIPHRVVTAPELLFTQVSCGKHHSAAVTEKGDLYTWGRNTEGQLGHVFNTLSKEVNAVANGISAWPKYVGFFLGKPRIVSASCGNTFTAVLLADGSIYLIGGSSLRPASYTIKKSVPSSNTFNLLLEKGSGGEPFVALTSGSEHILAVTNVGEVVSWGLNIFGQLGHGRKTGRGKSDVKGGKALPGSVSCDRVIKWTKVFAGASYSAAITTEHQLYTWGNGSYGQLGHGGTSCEFEPRRVEVLQHVNVGSVVCTERNLFVFAPTYISQIVPVCGECRGGYELRIRGSGFWASENVTVRFVPLTDGQLLRGTLGTFCEATGEVVCQVPKLRLTGEYAVEVSMNGKHFTTNGRVFTAFKRPQVAGVSVLDARFEGGEEVAVSLRGSLPEICRHPIVRFVRCCIDKDSGQLSPMNNVESLVAVGGFDERLVNVDEADVACRLLRLTLPALPSNQEGIAPFTLEISYDGGLVFTPVCVDITFVWKDDEDEDDDNFSHISTLEPHVIWAHDAHLVRVSPNSFLTTDLPQKVTLEVPNMLPPEVAQLLVTIVHTFHRENEDSEPMNMSITLSIDGVEGNFVTCTIPRLSEWQCIPPTKNKAQGLLTEWWKIYTKTGFVSHLHVSMNSGRTYLPAKPQLGGRSLSTAAQMFGMLATGTLLSIFPNVGMVSGGTQVAVAGDFFHFDTQDATVKLKWRDSSVVLPAICLRPEESTEVKDANSSTRRVVFRTPPLPFPDDSATAAAMDDGMILGAREEVEVFVSLDGEHFTDAGLSFMYCAIPEINGIFPQEAEPGTRMVLTVQKLIATSSACVKLESVESKLSLVVPAEIDEGAHTAAFVLPELPISTHEPVHVSLSLNGQEFTEVDTDSTVTTSEAKMSFLYKGITA
ncbi:Regulator of chromosome condensation (RCC1) repeat [Phytophthora infestans]|uniref:Regulator of chromosome condensation (RCC1) repeat n=1 Tax=Phytophthora infestans TaxID=4787 RepID=A0A833TCD6_PHYIN|nr:Regulator of chromosome condensation (RCC1) repeat [Phytophthora infestans]